MLLEIFLLIITGFSGVILLALVSKKPRFFWPILIAVSIGTPGLLIGGHLIGGFFWVDEYLLGCLLVGVGLAILIKNIHLQEEKRNLTDRLHLWIFFLLIYFMSIQYLRGFFLWEGDLIKISRWIIYYLMVGVLAFIVSKKPFSFFNSKKASLIASVSALLYLLLYLGHGLFSEIVRRINWFSLQGVEWSGSSYATFPLVVAIPAAIFLLKEKKLIYRLFGESLLGITIIASIYYQSRISLLVVFIFLAFVPFIFKFPKKVIIAIFISLILVVLILSIIGEGIVENLKYLYKVLTFGDRYEFYKEAGGDMDRYLHLRASFDASISSGWLGLFFGNGGYAHRFLLAPQLQKYRPGIVVGSITRTEAFSALLVDAGLIGLLLLILNFLLVAYKIFLTGINLEKIILLLVLLMTFAWLLVSNIQDIVLLYLLIMPSGLILQLAQYRKQDDFL